MLCVFIYAIRVPHGIQKYFTHTPAANQPSAGNLQNIQQTVGEDVHLREDRPRGIPK